MFPGQGTQYVNMGRELYRDAQTFRDEVSRCAELLRPHLGLDLREVLYPADADAEAASHRLRQTALTQPALFAVEYALARLWMSWGVEPAMMIGHSVGEYVAACLAGVLSLEDALALVAARGRLIQGLPEGAMLAVPLPESLVAELLGGGLSLAAVNAPSLCVVSGAAEEVEALRARLGAEGVESTRLHTSHAFHSAMMEPALAPFAELFGGVKLSAPSIPYVSNVTGGWINAAEATDPDYWACHLRQTVRFDDGVAALTKDAACVLVEVGPGATLGTLVRKHRDRAAGQLLLASLPRAGERRSDSEQMLSALGQLWAAGGSVDWAGLRAGASRRRVPLPTYPFERQRYWVVPSEAGSSEPRAVGTVEAERAERAEMSEWFYLPSWRPTLRPAQGGGWGEGAGRLWMVFDEGAGVGRKVAEALRAQGREVAVVRRGGGYERAGRCEYVVGEGREQYARAMREAEAEAGVGRVSGVIHLWALGAEERGAEEMRAEEGWREEFERAQRAGYYSLLRVVQAVAEGGGGSESVVAQVLAVTAGAAAGAGEGGRAEWATMAGVSRVAGQETGGLRCGVADVERGEGEAWAERVAERVLAEARGGVRDGEVRWRGGRRWVRSFEQVQAKSEADLLPPLRHGGLYVITGGLEGVGFEIAKYLARKAGAKLLLVEDVSSASAVSARAVPPLDGDETLRRARLNSLLEEPGAEVFAAEADVADEESMRGVIARAVERFGEVRGVVHAAGVVGERTFRTVEETGEAETDWHFRPKVYGAYVLEKIFRGSALDFFVLASSLSSVLGGRGLTAYCAANHFLDAFAQAASLTRGLPLLSINFDAWELTAEEAAGRPSLNPRHARLSMTNAEGAEAFQRALSMGEAGQVLISISDLRRRAAEQEKASHPAKSPRDEPPAGRAAGSHKTNGAGGAHGARGLEEVVTAAWRKGLGVEEVGPDDNFFDLGGDSLIAIQVISQLKKELGVEIPVVSLYEGLTVRYLVGLLEKLKGEESPGVADVAPAGQRQERASRRRDYIERQRVKKTLVHE
jgi:malonyl CoA-acyl carrier protein transacylase/acyl carrier protein